MIRAVRVTCEWGCDVNDHFRFSLQVMEIMYPAGWLLYGAVSICGQFSNTDVSRVPVYNVSCRVCGLHEKLLPEINLLAEAVKIQVKKFTKWWDSDGIVKEMNAPCVWL